MLYIDVSNIDGLGAKRVSDHIIDQVSCLVPKSLITLFVSPSNARYWSNKNLKIEVLEFNTILSPAINSFLKIFCLQYKIGRQDELLILGDYPVFFKGRQFLLVQQAHLISPKIYRYVDTSIEFRIKRLLFQVLSKSLERIYVQNSFMEDCLVKSYSLENCVTLPLHRTLPKVTKKIFLKRNHKPTKNVFYPTSLYAHKNNEFFLRVAEEINLADVEFRITLNKQKGFEAKNIQFLGKMNHSDVQKEYSQSDVLLFPSQIESLGLPIFEAIDNNIAVFLPNLECYNWIKHNNVHRYENGDIGDLTFKLREYLSKC